MPMNGSALEALLQPQIVSQIESQFGTPADSTKLQEFATALATAIANQVVSYIQSNALVTGTVTSGNGAGGAVTGTVS